MFPVDDKYHEMNDWAGEVICHDEGITVAIPPGFTQEGSCESSALHHDRHEGEVQL